MREEIPNVLFASSRPGYRARRVEEAVVAEWAARAKRHKIATIMCLLDDSQLIYYLSVADGLLAYYRRECFLVISHPVKDHCIPAVPPEVLNKAYADFLRAPKPLLVHCSAGVDRTGAVIRFIKDKLARGTNGSL